jgi:hypothetical protein
MVVPPISHLAPPTDSQSGGPLFVWERRRMAKAGGYGVSAGWGRGGRAGDLECRPRILVRIGPEVGVNIRGAKPSVPDGVRGGASPRPGPGRRRAWFWEDRPVRSLLTRLDSSSFRMLYGAVPVAKNALHAAIEGLLLDLGSSPSTTGPGLWPSCVNPYADRTPRAAVPPVGQKRPWCIACGSARAMTNSSEAKAA